jgi:predicted metal-dependent hydrolase
MIDLIKKYKEIGEVWYRSSTKAKSLNITVKPFKPVKVNIPHTITLKQAEAAVQQNKSWVIQEVNKMNAVEKKFTVFQPEMTYHFQDVCIQFIKSEGQQFVVASDGPKSMVVHTPMVDSFSSDQITFIKDKIILQKMKAWCMEHITPLAKKLAEENNIKIGKVTFRDTKTRWGSLGKHNNLNLSIYLATLPLDLIKYVILHELAHTKYKDHSKLYWGYLNKICVGYQKYEKELRSRGIGVI